MSYIAEFVPGIDLLAAQVFIHECETAFAGWRDHCVFLDDGDRFHIAFECAI